MKIIISESQYSFLMEQSDFAMDRRANALLNATGIRSDKDYKKVDDILTQSQKLMFKDVDPHLVLAIVGIGTAFIPVVGPFIAAGIGLLDAGLYYKEGDKTSAAISGVFSLLPFVGKIPGVKETSSAVWKAISSKLATGGKLLPAEVELVKQVGTNASSVQTALNAASKKLSPLVKQISELKPAYISRYGQDAYEKLMREFISGVSDQNYFLQTLRAGGKASPQAANFVTKFGIKFSKNEIDQIQKVINNINDDVVDIVKLETKNGPRTIRVKKVNADWVAKNAPNLTNSAGWAQSADDLVVINRGATQHMSAKGIDDLLMHEFGHIKDPSIVKSPVYQKLYNTKASQGIDALKRAADWEKLDWDALGASKPVDDIADMRKFGTKNYILNPNEIIANNTMTLQSLATQTKRYAEILPKEQVLKGLDDIINYAKGNSKAWSREAEWLLGYDYPYIKDHLASLLAKPSEYRKLWTKLAQQADYLKSQIKLSM